MKATPVFKSEQGRQKVLAHYQALRARLPFPNRERCVDTSYGSTYLLEAGAAGSPAVLLVHGSCSNSAMWFGDMAILSQRYHVYAVDIIGEAGNSAQNRLDLSTDAYADWIGQVLDALGIDRVMLMGNSLGGWMCLKFATAQPERVSKLVLIATSGLVGTRPSFLFRSILYVLMGGRGLRAMNRMVYGPREMPKEVMEVANMILQTFNPMVAALPMYDDARLRRLTMPVLYIAGRSDATVDVGKAAERLCALVPGAQVQIIEDSGHVVFGVMDRVMPFLGE